MKNIHVAINQLEPGMILSENFIHNNTTLLHAGTILTQTYITKLQYLSVDGQVLICAESARNNTSNTTNSKEIKNHIKESSKKLSEISSLVEDFYSNLDLENSLENHKLESIQENLKDNFELLKHTLKDIFVNTTEDDHIYLHSLNVSFISYLIGVWLELPQDKLSDLITSSLLHDIGKSKINPSILYKDDLTEEETQTLKRHPLIGYQLLKSNSCFNEDTILGVLTHHEHADGNGYPLRLKNSQIHLYGKIIQIADRFSNLTLSRPNKKVSVNPLKALKIMYEENFSKYDYKIWNVFYENMLIYYTGDYVSLNTGERGKILMMYKDAPNRPLLYVEDTYFAELKLDTSRFVKSIIEHI